MIDIVKTLKIRTLDFEWNLNSWSLESITSVSLAIMIYEKALDM